LGHSHVARISVNTINQNNKVNILQSKSEGEGKAVFDAIKSKL